MRSIFLFIILLLCNHLLLAQVRLKVVVTDANTQKPLPGATVSVAGKSQETSNSEGVFYIDCSRTNRFLISYTGYEAAEVLVKNCKEPLLIALNPLNQNLKEIEITATSNPNKTLLYQPVSITKLSSIELNRGTGLFMDDAINTSVPGATMQRRTVAGGQQINIRGYGNGVRGTNGISSNFDIQGTKVYLDGIPLTDAEGITVLDDIDFASIGNVEVEKGPSGTLYGLAIAGVLNLNTIHAERGRTSLGQNILVGSYGLRRFTTELAMSKEKSSLLANYGYQQCSGYMSHTASTKRFVNVAGNFQVNEKQSVNGYFGYSNSYDERGGELTISQYMARDYSGNPEYIKRNAHTQVISFRGGFTHTYNLNNYLSNTTTVFGSGVSNNISSAGGWTDKDPVNFGFRSVVSSRFPLRDNTNISGITGIETQSQYAQTIGYNMVANPANSSAYWIIGAMKSNQQTFSGTTSVFTEWTLSLPNDLSLTAGVGNSTMKIELNDRFYVANSTNPTRYAQKYSGMISPHLAINKVFKKAVSLYASYSKGYKAPVSSYFFIPTTGQLNTGLKPETGTQYEIGSKGSLFNDRISYQLAVFDALFTNKMTAVAVPLNSTTTAYSYVANGGKQENQGVEALVKYTAVESATGFVRLLRPFANLTYSHFRYHDFKFQVLNASRTGIIENDFSGKAVGGIAPIMANIGFDLLAAYGFYGNAVYTYKDPVPITSDGVYKSDSYNLLNAKLGIRRAVGEHFNADAFFGVNNITGTQYYNMVFVNQLPDAYLPAPLKSNYYGGISLKYIF